MVVIVNVGLIDNIKRCKFDVNYHIHFDMEEQALNDIIDNIIDIIDNVIATRIYNDLLTTGHSTYFVNHWGEYTQLHYDEEHFLADMHENTTHVFINATRGEPSVERHFLIQHYKQSPFPPPPQLLKSYRSLEIALDE